MKPECINAMNEAAGRKLSQVELNGIEQRLSRNMRQLARQRGEEWAGMSMADRVTAAARAASDELNVEQAKRKQRLELQVEAANREVQRMNDMRVVGSQTARALVEQLEQTGAYVKGVRNEYFSSLMDTLEAAQPRFFGWLENPEAVRDLVREIGGESTGNAIAAKGAKAWLDTVEAMRLRFNRAGGEVRKIDYGYLPQPHDAARVHRAGADVWVNDTLPLLDRNRYIKEDGQLMTEAEVRGFLRAAWQTIATDGLNKLEPGTFAGNGMRGKRGNKAREIHFKGGDAYLGYMQKYGSGQMFEAMQSHIGALSRDIALVETFGPNPDHLFRQLNDIAMKQDGGEKFVGPLLVRAKDVWNVLTGKVNQPVHARLGDIAQGVRNYTVAAKLQRALLSSFTDVPTLFAAVKYNRLPVLDTFVNSVRGFGKGSRDYANRAGLVADSIISDMNRWAEGHIGHNWTNRMADATMKVSLLNAWTDALRRGFSLTMMGALGKLSRTDWGKLNVEDQARLARRGITPDEWRVWRLAETENWRGSRMLTPEAVRAVPDEALTPLGDPEALRDRAVTKLLGFIVDESETAVTGQDLSARAAITRSTQRGTPEGEFLRSLLLFKGFPLALMSRQIRRIQEIDDAGGKVAYAVSLGVGLTLFGALSLQAKDMVTGKDPRDMTDYRFWAAAFVQGGGLGIYTDLLYVGMGGDNRGGAPNWASLAGPVFGGGFDLANLTLGNLQQAIEGKNTKAGAELVRFSRQNMPFVNLWYGSSALDHMFLHELQEGLSPGYLEKYRRRVQREHGQEFWWEPGADFDEMRAPQMDAAFGQ